MQVNQYLFQSPSTSPVQVGRLDPASVEKETTANTNTSTANLATSTAKSQPVHSTQVESVQTAQVVEPTINSNQLLDVYA